MGLSKFSELTFDDIVKMKVTDVAIFCGYSVENMKYFSRDFKEAFGFSFADYKRTMVHDFVKQHAHHMTTEQLAKVCNMSTQNVLAIKRRYKLKDYEEKKKTISALLAISDEEVIQTVKDLYPAEYIRIKVKKKIKSPKIKIKLKRLAQHWGFVIMYKRKKVAEGEYHKELPFDAVREIRETYLRLV